MPLVKQTVNVIIGTVNVHPLYPNNKQTCIIVENYHYLYNLLTLLIFLSLQCYTPCGLNHHLHDNLPPLMDLTVCVLLYLSLAITYTYLDLQGGNQLTVGLTHQLLYHIPFIAVDLLWVCNAILSELQDHLGTFSNSLVIALTARQEVWVLFHKVWVIENH